MTDERAEASISQEDHVSLLGVTDDAPRLLAPPESKRKEVDIFISYRVEPDESLARAMKKLLEGTLSPTPHVFVSGLGGIRASQEGFREQIRRAATSAKVFFGIITTHSADREWILFEAGAAFGGNVPYVPVLFDIGFEALSSTISGNQATKHNDKDRVLQVVRDIAPLIGCEVASHFGQRFGAYLRFVDSIRRSGMVDNTNSFEHARQLAIRGDWSTAAELFDQEIDEAKSADMRCRIRLFKHAHEPDSDGKLTMREFLDTLEPDEQSTPTWLYWSGNQTLRPTTRAALYRAALASTNGSLPNVWLVDALQTLMENEYDPQEATAARLKLLEHVANGSEALASLAAKAIVSPGGGLSQLSKLILVSVAHSTSYSELLPEAHSVARDLSWPALSLLFAQLSVDHAGAVNHNAYGIALEVAELKGLAFQAYQKAADAGVSVARANMASLMLNDGNSGAAQLMLEGETSMDSADTSYPHRLRASVEAAVGTERDRLERLLEQGRRQLKAISTIGELALENINSEHRPTESFALSSGDGNVAHFSIESDGTLSISILDICRDVAMVNLPLFGVLYHAVLSDGDAFLFTATGKVQRLLILRHGLEPSVQWFVPTEAEVLPDSSR